MKNQSFCSNAIFFPPLIPQSTTLGITNLSENSLLLNYLLLIIKYYVYYGRNDGDHSIDLLKANIYKTKNIEK